MLPADCIHYPLVYAIRPDKYLGQMMISSTLSRTSSLTSAHKNSSSNAKSGISNKGNTPPKTFKDSLETGSVANRWSVDSDNNIITIVE